MRDKLVKTALRYLGVSSVPYQGRLKGKSSETGFDCSGFVTFVLEQCAFPIPDTIRRSYEYFDRFGVFIHEEICDAGDLVFFSYHGLRPQHIGIMTSRDEFIHAPGKRNSHVKISKIRHRPIKRKKEGYIYVKNPIGFKRLTIRNGKYHEICI